MGLVRGLRNTKSLTKQQTVGSNGLILSAISCKFSVLETGSSSLAAQLWKCVIWTSVFNQSNGVRPLLWQEIVLTR